ncbi:TspO/MBR family protein [Bradymonas sediminis]|uniref:Tryptophan-rich sensory protein n=1 Tax=Bradymonas sediminis TaxID=1548548 RepID=A0A2Z4FLN3_9DELT|nr:TspO/MBR family protein [Bradymonas sediminis]AWV89889.1 tryptophan-rich sensory protein [Bradymonas sediminis]TDP61989.1 TspO/MBR related protein [Bradymonas sediminis]
MSDLPKKQQTFGLIGWLVLSYIVSAIGGVASFQARAFYADLTQPAWAPPGWLFGPTWMVLYTMMGVAAWLVWREGGAEKNRIALGIFIVQLAVNGVWSWLFFAWSLGALAFADIVLLWLLIVATIALFWRTRPLAGALLIPYLLWVSFAAALNFAVWQLNPQILG